MGQTNEENERDTLRRWAERRGLSIGTCVGVHHLRKDPRYAATVTREFNVITPENAMKFGKLSPARGIYDFAAADALVDFARAHGMAVRGHVLVWYLQLPHWLHEKDLRHEEIREIYETHIRTVVGRYAGRIATWDVVNEAVAEDGTYRQSIWYKAMGPDYVDIAFQAARESDPNALLFYNDFGIEATRSHAESVYRLVAGLRERGRPIDGVGLQMHLELGHLDAARSFGAELERFAGLGLRTHVTELDVRIPLRGGQPPAPAELETQSEIYRSVLRACLEAPSCDTLISWGVSDRFSWVPHFFPGHGAALLFDAEYREKPAYDAMLAELRGDPR